MASELQIENFHYDMFKEVAIKVTNDWLRKCEEVAGEILTSVDERLCMLELEGYGLLSQREIITLKIENAKLKKENTKTIQDLEKQLQEINREIKQFLIKFEDTTLD